MKLRYVLGLSLLAATVAFTSCSKDEKKDDNKKKEQKDNKDNKEEQKAPTLKDIAGTEPYMITGAGQMSVSVEGEGANDKLKIMAGEPPLNELQFTLGETKDGVTTLKGVLGDAFVKLEGKYSVADKKKKIEITYQEKGDGKKETKIEATQDVK